MRGVFVRLRLAHGTRGIRFERARLPSGVASEAAESGLYPPEVFAAEFYRVDPTLAHLEHPNPVAA